MKTDPPQETSMVNTGADFTPIPPTSGPLAEKSNPYPTSRHPLVIFLLLLCMISGIPALLGVAEPQSIQDTLPAPLRLGWCAMLTFGPVVAIAGIVRDNLSSAITLEQIGCVSLGGSSITYGVALLQSNGEGALQAGAIIVVFGLFVLARVVQLRNWVNRQHELGLEIRRGN
jgi:hypothetical protein